MSNLLERMNGQDEIKKEKFTTVKCRKKNDKDNSLQNKEKIAGVPKLFHTKMLTPHMLQRNWGGTKGFDSQSES